MNEKWDRLLTINESADRLNVSGRTMRRMLDTGKSPYLRVGNACLRIRESDIRRHLDTHTIHAGAM